MRQLVPQHSAVDIAVGGMKIEHVFLLERFEHRVTPTAIRCFEQIFILPLMAFWASGVLIVFEFARGNLLRAVLRFPFWVFAVWVAPVALHRAGYARIGISLGTTQQHSWELLAWSALRAFEHVAQHFIQERPAYGVRLIQALAV